VTGFGERARDLLADHQGSRSDDVPEAPERTRLLVPGVGARTVDTGRSPVASFHLLRADPICSVNRDRKSLSGGRKPLKQSSVKEYFRLHSCSVPL
jgi:hypothetical protein